MQRDPGAEEFDYVIVGAGTAGSIVAARLAEDPAVAVCVLEAGASDLRPTVQIPAGFPRTLTHSAIVWPFTTEPTKNTGGRRIAVPQGRVVGGSGSINGMIYVRGQPADYDHWARLGNRGWGYADVLPYFARTERRIGGGEEGVRGRSGPIPVTDMDWIHPVSEAFIAAAVKRGVPRNPDYNGGDQEGVGYFQRTIYRGLRVSTAAGFLKPALRRGNVKLVTEAVASGVVFDGHRARAVRYVRTRGGAAAQVVARREVILCCGTVNTARLLQISGVGPADLLNELGVRVVRDLGGVGQNLIDHYSARIVMKARPEVVTLNELSRGPRLGLQVLRWAMKRPSIMALTPSQVFMFCRSAKGLELPDLQCVFTPGSYKEGRHYVLDHYPGVTGGAWQHRPQSRGFVRATSTDPYADPIIQPNYLDHPLDQQVMVAGMQLVRGLLHSEDIARYVTEETIPGGKVQSDDEMLDFCKNHGATGFHLVGTARMGTSDDRMAVVDDQLRVHGLDALRIADASVMPMIPSANTYAATMMIAEKAATNPGPMKAHRRRVMGGVAWVAVVAVVLVPTRSHAQEAGERPRPRMVAVRTSTAPDIDGDVRDAAWQQAIPTSAFTQKFPSEGQSPSEPTELRVLYDDAALYVAFDCVQVGTPVKARLARRDRQVEADWVQVAVDDGASTHEFAVNAAGVLGDGVRFNDTDYSAQWDGVWDAQVRQHDGGWSAEMRIPLRIFRDSTVVRDWGFQARRYISGRQETVEWAFIPRTAAGEVSHYGRLSGIARVQRANPLELLPYVAAGLDWSDMTRDHRAFGDLGRSATVGLDVRWRIAQNLTLDATVNPDFAQVEADQLVLNLTTYETFVPEKRPFFVNGLELFQVPRMELYPTPQTLFYTRRIGSVPPVPEIGDGGAGAAATPIPSTIYAAAKLNAQLGGLVTAGVVSAVTGRNDVAITAPGGAARDYLADPLELANVARIKVAVGGGAHVGLLATAVQRFEPDGAYPLVTQSDGSEQQQCPDGTSVPRGARCFHDAYVAGLDGSWRSASGTYAMAGQALATLVEHGPARTMPDGTVIKSGDAAAEGRVYLAKEGGQWRGSVEADVIGRRVDYNDLGYVPRANQVRLSPYLAYRIVDPFWEIAEMETYANSIARSNLDGLALLRGYYLGSKIRFKNFWSVLVEAARYPARGEDRQVGDGTALERLGGTGLTVSVTTDPRRQLAATAYSETVVTSQGGSFELDGELTYLPLPRLELQLVPVLMFRSGDARFVSGSREDGAYTLGDLEAQSVSTTLRASYTFTNRLTLQLYGQLLLIAEHYTNFRSLEVDPAARRPVVRLGQLTPTAPPGTDPDNEETTLNVSAVLRWEFRPGSTLFLVYSRLQAPTLMPGREARLDLGALREGPASDAIRLKLSYYWN